MPTNPFDAFSLTKLLLTPTGATSNTESTPATMGLGPLISPNATTPTINTQTQVTSPYVQASANPNLPTTSAGGGGTVNAALTGGGGVAGGGVGTTGVGAGAVGAGAVSAGAGTTGPYNPFQNAGANSNPLVLWQMMQSLQANVASSNSLMTQRNLVMKALYDKPLTPEERVQLPESVLKSIDSGDRANIDTTMRLISDQISGKTNTMDQSVQYLTSAYQNMVSQTETARQNAISNVNTTLKDFQTSYTALGYTPDQATGAAIKYLEGLYGTQGVQQLKGLGIDLEGLGTLYTGAEVAGGGSISYQTNNPGNIKYGAFAASMGGTDSGIVASDGGTFAKFSSLEAGTQAQQQLLTSPTYANLTLDAAMKLWSNNGYGAEIAPELDPMGKIKDFKPEQLNYLMEQMKTAEGFTTPAAITAAGAPGTTGNPAIDSSTSGYATTPIPGAGNLTQAAIDAAAMKYALTGTMPSIGLSSTGQGGLRKNAILNRAGELEGGANIEANKAKLTSLSASLGTQTNYLNTMQRSILTVDDNLKILQAGADKVNKSNSPLINEWTNMVKQNIIGSGDLNAYMAAIQTVRSEYSIILARGNTQGITESVRADAKTLIPDKITKSQLLQVIGVLQSEGQNVVKEAQATVDSIANQINSIVAPSSAGGATSGMSDEQAYQLYLQGK